MNGEHVAWDGKNFAMIEKQDVKLSTLNTYQVRVTPNRSVNHFLAFPQLLSQILIFFF